MTPRGGRASAFDLLGLPASREVTDDDVRAAWRRIAAATHPDRADGGDPERFALASAAYTALRTRYSRGEVLAELAGGHVTAVPASPAARAPAPAADLPPDAAAPPAATPPGDVPPGTAPPEAVPPGTAPPEAVPAVAAPPEAVPPGAAPAGTAPPGPALPGAGGLFWRIRRGRPGVLAVRITIAAVAGAGSVAVIGFAPSALALIAGAATWLALTARHDLAPPGPG